MNNTKEYKLTPIDKDAHVMTLDSWLEAVKYWSFIDYDGVGHYAFEKEESSIRVWPSSVKAEHKDDCKVMIRKRKTNPEEWYGYTSDECSCGAAHEIDESKVDRRFTHIIWYNR